MNTRIRYTILLPVTEFDKPSVGRNPRTEAAATVVGLLRDRFSGGTVYSAPGGGAVLSGWWKDKPSHSDLPPKTYIDSHLRVDIDVAVKDQLIAGSEREEHVDEIVELFRRVYKGRIREKEIYVFSSDLTVHMRSGTGQ